MLRGDVQLIVVLPPQFEARLLRGLKPVLYVAADATDPSASANAVAALGQLATQALRRDLTGPLRALNAGLPGTGGSVWLAPDDRPSDAAPTTGAVADPRGLGLALVLLGLATGIGALSRARRP